MGLVDEYYSHNNETLRGPTRGTTNRSRVITGEMVGQIHSPAVLEESFHFHCHPSSMRCELIMFDGQRLRVM